MITIRCTCGESYQADEQHAGRHIRCKCGKMLEIVTAPIPRDSVSSQKRFDSSSKGPSKRHPKVYSYRNLKLTARHWVFAAIAATVLLLFWDAYHVENPPQEKDLSTSFRPAPPAIPAPVAAVQPVPPPCQANAQIRPRSGAELGRRYRGGLGRLQVSNGLDSDAIAVLIDDATEAPRRAIFIRSGESGVMTSIPQGRYRLRFQLGLDWLAERQFCQKRGTSEFDSAFNFEEVTSDRRTKYSIHEVTLNPVPLGKARIHMVSDESFELPPP